MTDTGKQPDRQDNSQTGNCRTETGGRCMTETGLQPDRQVYDRNRTTARQAVVGQRQRYSRRQPDRQQHSQTEDVKPEGGQNQGRHQVGRRTSRRDSGAARQQADRQTE
jgi:hypothetical protein